jgi:hypothetical protein
MEKAAATLRLHLGSPHRGGSMNPKKSLTLDSLRVETFEAGGVEISEAIRTVATGIDSTCPCCDTRPDFCP